MSLVLFASNRPLDRAENIKAAYEAYDGEKIFIQRTASFKDVDLNKYDLMVTDDYPDRAPKKCIHIGHGPAAGKTAGLDQPIPYIRSELITYATTSSKEMIPVVAKQCGIPEEKVIPLGFPRTDYYINNSKVKKQRREYLYAPTFRHWDWLPDIGRISNFLPPRNLLVVKPHMFTGDFIVNYWNNVQTASCRVQSTQYLMRADVLITDYSSIMFDGMVLRTPIILFAKDKDKYLSSRGMYFQYPEEYSPYFCDNENELVDLMLDAKWNDQFEEIRKFYVGACDGHSCERLNELIRSVL